MTGGQNAQDRSLAFLYPGQGSQYVGMGRAVCESFQEARGVFEEADAALRISISRLCFDGSEEELCLTENTQPAILATSVAVHRVLAAHGLQPHWVAGHSLGEYSALVAAGSLALVDAIRLVNKRGRYMQEAVAPGVGAMVAVLGLGSEQVSSLCSEYRGEGTVEVANFNAPSQVVIAGDRGAVEAVAGEAKRAGARRAVMLNVSAPFHCMLMQPAADRLREDLLATRFDDPRARVLCNVDARPLGAAEQAREKLFRQVTEPVRWAESLEFLAAAGVRTFVEVGPGRVLSGLAKRTLGRQAEVHAVAEPEEVEALLSGLAAARPAGGGG